MFGLLAIFFVWYGTTWAYRNLYKEPRRQLNEKITRLRQEIDKKGQSVAFMKQHWETNQVLYYRSLPRVPNAVRLQYKEWMSEVLEHCEVENGNVSDDNPTRTNFGGINYRFHVRGVCTLDQLSQLLFEFYYAPFLHRITAMNVIPQESSEKVAISLTIDGLSIPPPVANSPYPPTNQLTLGFFHQRLATHQFEAYRVVAERNLFRAARGGVDEADLTYLTGLPEIDGEREAWFTIRAESSDSDYLPKVIKAKPGEQIAVGSFRATIKEILDESLILDRDGTLWLLELIQNGACLNTAFALPPEAALNDVKE